MPTAIPQGVAIGNQPTVNGQDVTVSRLLNNPRWIERRLSEVIQPIYWADKVFQNAGTAPSGAVIVEEWTPEIVELDRREEELADDVEVPLAGITVGDIKTLEATEHGLGYVVTDRHVRRNQRWIVDRRERALAYTLADGQNRRAMLAMNAAIAAHTRVFPSPDWSAVIPDGASPTPRDQWPHATIARVKAQQIKDRVPFGYDTLIADPLEIWRLKVLYGGPTGSNLNLADLASKLDVRQVLEDTTGVIEHGKPTLVASTGFGGRVEEAPTTVEVIDERRRKRRVVQATGAALFFVDNPWGAIQLTGTAVEDLTP